MAAAFAWPRPVELDVGAWFAAALRHDVTARGGDVASVTWGPLLRWAERKVGHPGVEAVPGAPLPGEASLEEALAALPDVPARWERLLGEACAPALDALPADQAPARWLGPDVDVADLRVVAEDAERRLRARWIAVAGDPRDVPDVAGAFDDVVPWRADGVDVDDAPAALAEALRARVPDDDPARRLFLVAAGEGTWALLRALAAQPGLRDRVLGVVSVGGWVAGDPDRDDALGEASCTDWMDANWRHELFDTEIVRPTLWASMQWFDPTHEPPGAAGVPIAAARFADPEKVDREPPFVEAVDLGVLPASGGPTADEVARALRVTAGLWALARR